MTTKKLRNFSFDAHRYYGYYRIKWKWHRISRWFGLRPFGNTDIDPN